MHVIKKQPIRFCYIVNIRIRFQHVNKVDESFRYLFKWKWPSEKTSREMNDVIREKFFRISLKKC